MAITVVGTVLPASVMAQSCTKPAKLGVSMIVDDSGSMAGHDPFELRREGANLALDLLPDGSVAAAGSFDSESREFFGPREVDATSRQPLRDEMYFSASGDTDFDLGFALAGEQLDAMPAAVDRKALIFLSDGEDNDDLWYEDQSIADQGIPIFTIAFGDANVGAMREIAEGDGRPGRVYDVSDSSGLQAAFADIVNTLTCRGAKLSQEVTFAPGERKEFPFDIREGDKGWDGIVTWDEGAFDVSAVRPDGSTLDAQNTLGDEVFDARERFRRSLSSRRPAVGGWKLVVRAAADNDSQAHVELRIFDQDAGGATLTLNLPAKDAPFVIPRRNALQRGVKAVTGTPFSLWLQPYVQLSGKVSPGVAVPEILGQGTGAYRVETPAATWEFSAENLRWNGPPLTVGDLGIKPPAFTTPQVSLAQKGPNATLDQALVVNFARALELSYKQEFPVDPAYASLTFTGGLNLQAGTYVVDATAWAATRALAALGAGAVSGGTGAAAVAAFTAKQSAIATAVQVADVVQTLRSAYGVAVSNEELLRRLGEATAALAQQLGPQILERIKQSLKHVVAAVTTTVKNAINRFRGRLKLGFFARASQVPGSTAVPPLSYAVAPTLSAERLTGRPELRAAGVQRKRVPELIRLMDRYGTGTSVEARRLLVSGRFKAGRSLGVASKLPHAPKGRDKTAVLTLRGPGGFLRERLVTITDRRAAALVRLPRKLPAGRWQLALASYPDLTVPGAKVDVALGEFTVNAKKAAKAKGKRARKGGRKRAS